MKAGKLVAIALAIVAGAACAGPWYNGMHVDHSMREYAEQRNADKQSPLSITLVSFDHGWLSSEAVLVLNSGLQWALSTWPTTVRNDGSRRRARHPGGGKYRPVPVQVAADGRAKTRLRQHGTAAPPGELCTGFPHR